MSVLENRPNSALLVVDVQNFVLAEAYERDVVVANIDGLVHKARQERVPVGLGPAFRRGAGKGQRRMADCA